MIDKQWRYYTMVSYIEPGEIRNVLQFQSTIPFMSLIQVTSMFQHEQLTKYTSNTGLHLQSSDHLQGCVAILAALLQISYKLPSANSGLMWKLAQTNEEIANEELLL